MTEADDLRRRAIAVLDANRLEARTKAAPQVHPHIVFDPASAPGAYVPGPERWARDDGAAVTLDRLAETG